MGKLLKCPFCGGEATLKRDQKDDFVEWSVGCYNRGCVCSAHTYCYDNKDDAIRDWNTRTPMANIVEKLEEMKKDSSQGCEKVNQELCNSYFDCGLCLIDRIINIVKQEINNGLE